jgi:mono/diheme cytochrome c family protein
LTGGCVYYGDTFPDLQGAYLYGDYSTGKIWGLLHDGQRVVWRRELADTALQISGFGLDSQGELLILDYGGGFYRLEPAPAEAQTAPFPARLSETGVFASVPEHRVQPGLVPYSVNAPLWSDGAYKERYFGIPQAAAEKQRIGFTTQGAWQFPDGTVLVKSFALETIEGDADSRRWIETRLLTRQQGEWVGYSYAWNDEQTDAELVAAGGADRDFAIAGKAPAEGRVQHWRYPSRAECMTCHSRAAGFVLGLNTLQMNKPHAYGETIENQLQTLERADMLRVDWLAEAKQAVRQEAATRGLQEAELNAYLARQFHSQGQRQPTSTALLFQAPSAYARLADPYDEQAELDVRARSYLHVNCAQCHVQAGGGNAQIDVSFSTPAQKTKLFDERPQHHTFGIAEARIVAPGFPERSVLYRRMQMRTAGQMPPLATSRVDEQAVRLLHDWIEQLAPATPATR